MTQWLDMEDVAEHAQRAGYAVRLLSAISYEVDRSDNGKTCNACTDLRVVAAIRHYLGDGAYSVDAAIAIARDHAQNRCPEDEARAKERAQ